MKAYIEWIDTQINALQTEIARLTVAREVIVELQDIVRAPEARLLKPRAPYKKRQGGAGRGASRLRVLAALRTLGQPVKPIAIIEHLDAASDRLERKAIYNALVRMKQEGEVVLDGGLYSLPPSELFKEHVA